VTQCAYDTTDLDELARSRFGWNRLTDEQCEAIRALLDGRDLLAVLPTGSGKSAIYQVASLLIDGLTLVVSPLIALQQDQIAAIEESGAGTAVAINSGLRARELRRNWEAVEGSSADFVFISPEQLANDEVLSRLSKAQLSLIVVDEAHCVSAWGHDFRPDYRRLADAFRRMGESIPVAALTATASVVVRRDIVERLELTEPAVLVGGFDRPNISLAVQRFVDDDEKRSAVADFVAGLNGAGLLYVATRKDAEAYAETLRKAGLTAATYHAGMTKAQRDAVHAGFRESREGVVVATSAFGMGIDKPDVRFIVHASIPDSLDSYYQQVGRAGRDGDDAQAVLFYRPEDLGLARFFTSGRTGDNQDELLRAVFDQLADRAPTRLKELRSRLQLRGRRLTNVVNVLVEAGAVRSIRDGLVRTVASAGEAVERAVRQAKLRERVDLSRVEMMRGYAETDCCRRIFLLSYFGEQLTEPCGNCDRCLDNNADQIVAEPALPVGTVVRHHEWERGRVIGGDADRITVLFDDYGYRILAMAAVRDNDLLDLAEA
jgi:ATP-dependent DNA helicase RecQ